MIVVLVLMLAAVPAAITLLHNARSDLASALDDYHYTRAKYVAHSLAELAKQNPDLALQVADNWPDSEVTIEIDASTITVRLDRVIVSVDYD